MASTSMSLGKHWEDYLNTKVASGEFKTKAEVVRDALRRHQERDNFVKSFLADMKQSEESGFTDIPTKEEIAERLDKRLAIEAKKSTAA